MKERKSQKDMSHPRSYRTQSWKKRKSRGLRGKKWFKQTKLPKHFAKNAFLVLIAAAIAGSLGLLGVFAFYGRDLPDPNSLTDRSISQTTKIYDRSGEHLLYEIFGEENRTLAKFQEGFCKDGEAFEFDEEGIPLHALQATIAAEDARFCTHHGFSVKGLARAVVFQGRRGGGSTLTQQLVKNAILTNERRISRKIKELILSIELERRYSKDEILQIYFNEIPYGSTYYGIRSATQNYYDKEVKDLTIAQAATLAAMPQAPTTYLNNPDRLTERRDWIIGRMLELEFITEEEANAALAEESSLQVDITNIQAPHFVFHVKEQLDETYGQRQVETGGLKVITSLDYELQKIGEEEVLAGVEARSEQYDFENASLVAIDPKTGQVLTMVGSKDFFSEEIDGQVNVATRLRQPGSSFKPIVYAKAFDFGYTPNTVLWDVKTNFPTATGTYSPNNYDLGERGPIRIREALQTSLNIPAVKALYLVGVDNAIDFAESLGYTSFGDRSNFGLSVVLGGAEVKLLEHVNAYATFANEGTHHNIVTILRVEDAEGAILEQWQEEKGTEVLSQNIARTITNVLSDNNARAATFGTGSPLQLGARPVAAKTGTTNDYRDAWTVGYTPSLAVGVWAGNNDNSEMQRGAGGSTVTAPIWNAFMKRALEDKPVESFTPPSIPQTGKAILDGRLDTTTAVVDTASGKLATEYTPESFREERMFAEYHTILHYIERSSPTAPAPNPPTDPYYESWEAAVQDWIRRKQEETGIVISQEAAPTEFDDVHIPENFPSVTIHTPRDNQSFATRTISVEVEARAPRGVSRVEFYIDGFFLGSDVSEPFRIDRSIPSSISRGYHTLKVLAYDDVDNVGSDTVGISVENDAISSGVELLDPKNGQSIERTSEPFTAVVSLDSPTDFVSVSVYQESIGVGGRILVETKTDPTTPFLTFAWTLPEPGDWVLFASGVKMSGEVVETAGIVVSVHEGSSEPEPPTEEPPEEEKPEPLLNLNPFQPPPQE